MKIRTTLTIIALFLLQLGYAQIVNPVKGSIKLIPIKQGVYKIVYSAKLDTGWHVFSGYNDLKGSFGPVLLNINFDTAFVKPIGPLLEVGKRSVVYDQVFEMPLQWIVDSIHCEQVIKVMRDTKLKGNVVLYACNDRSCTPPQEEYFSFNVKAAQSKGIFIEWDTTRSEADPIHKGQQTYPNTYPYCGIMPFKQTLAIITKRMGLCFLTSYIKLAA